MSLIAREMHAKIVERGSVMRPGCNRIYYYNTHGNVVVEFGERENKWLRFVWKNLNYAVNKSFIVVGGFFARQSWASIMNLKIRAVLEFNGWNRFLSELKTLLFLCKS